MGPLTTLAIFAVAVLGLSCDSGSPGGASGGVYVPVRFESSRGYAVLKRGSRVLSRSSVAGGVAVFRTIPEGRYSLDVCSSNRCVNYVNAVPVKPHHVTFVQPILSPGSATAQVFNGFVRAGVSLEKLVDVDVRVRFDPAIFVYDACYDAHAVCAKRYVHRWTQVVMDSSYHPVRLADDSTLVIEHVPVGRHVVVVIVDASFGPPMRGQVVVAHQRVPVRLKADTTLSLYMVAKPVIQE